jgi:hypothetical protein
MKAQIVEARPKGNAHLNPFAESWERYKSAGRPGWSLE